MFNALENADIIIFEHMYENDSFEVLGAVPTNNILWIERCIKEEEPNDFKPASLLGTLSNKR